MDTLLTKRFFRKSALTVLALALLIPVPAYGAPDQLVDPTASSSNDLIVCVDALEDNTRRILLKLVEFERFNLNYKLTVAKQGRWKGWRYFTFTESNNAVSLSGYLVGLVERTKNFDTPKKLDRQTLERGNVVCGIGQILGASGSALELGINAYHEIETHRKGFAPKEARAKVKGYCEDVNALFVEREQLINKLSSRCGATKYEMLSRAEDPVLLDIRDISLDEFRKFHSSARRLLAFQQSLYLVDIARNTLGAISNRFGYLALHTGDRHNNTKAGVFSAISGSLTVLNPLVSRGVGKVVGEYHKHYVKTCMADFKGGSVEKLTADLESLKKLATTPELEKADLPVLRCALYSEHESNLKKQVSIAERELRAGVLAATENVASGALVGGSRIAGGGVLFMIAGSRFPYNGKRTNIYLGTANIIGTSAASYALIDNLRIQLKREMDYRKFKKNHVLPGQIFKDRLAQLDDMESKLKSIPNSSSNFRINQISYDTELGG